MSSLGDATQPSDLKSIKPSSAVLMAATEAVITAILRVPDIALTCDQRGNDPDETDAGAPIETSAAAEAASEASNNALVAVPEGFGVPWTPPISQEYFQSTATSAAGSGNLPLLAWLHAQHLYPLSRHICFEAILRQQLPTLEWLRLNGPPWPWGTDACVAAVLSRGTVSLQWLLAQEPPGYRHQDVSACVNAAAISGCWETLRWLLETYPAAPWDFGKACCGHQPPSLHYNCASKRKRLGDSPAMATDLDAKHWLQALAVWWAIKTGQLGMLKWMSTRVSKEEFNVRAELLCKFGLQHGHTDVLEWLCSQNAACLQVLLRNVTSHAADLIRGRHSAAFSWLHATHIHAAESGQEVDAWDAPALCYHAVAVGSLEGLQMLKPQSLGLRPHDWDMLCKRSLQYGHLDIAQWLYAQDPESWFWACGHACTLAARYGFLHILRWLSEAAPPRPDDIGPCTEAAARGRLAIMKWARSVNYAWDESTYVAAAAVPGNLEMLEWMAAQEPSCPVNNAALMVCARDGDIHMLRWALQQPQIPQEPDRPLVPHNMPLAKRGRLLPLMQKGWVPEHDTAALCDDMQRSRFAFYACAKRLASLADVAETATSLTKAALEPLAGGAEIEQCADQQQQLLPKEVPDSSGPNLGSLPPEILCKIACHAQIDFAWMHAEHHSTDRRVSCSGPCCARYRRPAGR